MTTTNCCFINFIAACDVP